MSNLTPEELERFNSKWIKEGECHIWQGSLDRDGYGTFYLRRRNRRAHRVGWYTKNGEVKPGHVINHTCRKRACVNPQHLQSITVTENALKDSSSPAYINSQKTTCPRGHAYDKVQIVKGKSQRVCTICEKAKSSRLAKRWRQENTLNV